jgi:hypothetical protein
MVTPPILRLGPPALRAMLEDDWERISNYYIYSMFPFGRLLKDFTGKNNLIDNPQGLMEKWTGFPGYSLKKLFKTKEEDIQMFGL